MATAYIDWGLDNSEDDNVVLITNRKEAKFIRNIIGKEAGKKAYSIYVALQAALND